MPSDPILIGIGVFALVVIAASAAWNNKRKSNRS